MTESLTLVAADDLRGVVTQIFHKQGMPQAAASHVAEVLVWADAGGHSSHGVRRVQPYLKFIEKGQLDPAAAPTQDVNAGALFRIDARRSAGPVALAEALRLSTANVQKHGISFGVVSHTTHIGAAGFYAERLAQQGCLGIVLAAGIPLMAYHGAAKPSVATAPIAIGVPGGTRPPLLLDMASSVVALGKIAEARSRGEPLQPGWALTADGKPTTDPNLAAIQLPLGGPKGAGLALMFECIASLLSAAPILAHAVTLTTQRHTQNAAVLAIDVSRFRPLDDFAKDVDDLIGAIKALPKTDGTEQILMPGERSQRLRAQSMQDGIELPTKLWDELRSMAGDS